MFVSPGFDILAADEPMAVSKRILFGGLYELFIF